MCRRRADDDRHGADAESALLKYIVFAGAIAGQLTMGYVGDDVELILTKRLVEAQGDVKKAEQGIVYIDEVDKIADAPERRGLLGGGGGSVRACHGVARERQEGRPRLMRADEIIDEMSGGTLLAPHTIFGAIDNTSDLSRRLGPAITTLLNTRQRP